MSLPLFIALYSGIAFAIYFIICYFDICKNEDEADVIIGCVAWPMFGGFWLIIMLISIPIGICYLTFEGVKYLAERARDG